MKKIANGVLEVTGEMFIIPNSFITINNLILESDKKRYKQLETMKDAFTPDSEELVLTQVWIVSEDLESENLADHGGKFQREDGSVGIVRVPSRLPVGLFVGKQENDVVDVTITKEVMGEKYDFDLVMHLSLKQTKYRYRNFGTFEETFNTLWKDFKMNHPEFITANA